MSQTPTPLPAHRTEPDPDCKLRDKPQRKKPQPVDGWQVRHDKETDKP